MRARRISATAVRFIKLGRAGKYERAALEDRRLYLGYHSVPHQASREGDWTAVNRHFLDEGHRAHVASNHVRQVQGFYEQPESCLWITFIDDDMWWTFARAGVRMCQNWKRSSREQHGPSRYRSCVESWRNTNINGRRLRMRQLPGYVTKVASGFRGATCQIDNSDAVLRIINDQIDPRVKEAIACRDALVVSLEKVVDRLFWKDFETLIDLIFQRSGWPRISRVGGSQKLIEFELENPVTGERSFAQVKSQARQATLNDYVRRFERDTGYKQMFFVCHTAKGELHTEDPDVFVWTGPNVADMAVRTGLADWVLEKVQ
jgi:hypothetical protein